MKKCKERRTITRALVLYQRLGLCECSSFPFYLYERINGACGKNRDLANDLWAIHETLLHLRVINDNDALKAVHHIYFRPFQRNISSKDIKNEISYRIIKYAKENYMDERTVYRKLQKAKKIFFLLRKSCK